MRSESGDLINQSVVPFQQSGRGTALKAATRVISFTSGKGGVGKTTCVVNTAIALARLQSSVLILDADLGLANVNVLLGIRPEKTLTDFFAGEATLDEVLVEGPEGIKIIPSSSGDQSICTLSSAQRMMLMSGLENLSETFDYMLIDTQAGISSEVMYFNSASGEIVCVINQEPTSLTDAYALIKILSRNYGEKSISVLANNVPGEKAAKTAFRRLERAVEQFLHIQLNYLGHVPSDLAVNEAVHQQKALVELYPSSPAGRSFAGLGAYFDSEYYTARTKGGMQFFFEQLLEVGANGR